MLQIHVIFFGVAELAAGELDREGKINDANLYRSKHKCKAKKKYASGRGWSRSNKVGGDRGEKKSREGGEPSNCQIGQERVRGEMRQRKR